MKKILQMALVLVVTLGFASAVNAATEQQLIDHVSKSYLVAGKNVRIRDEYINQLKQYLNEREVSEANAQAVIDDFDAAVGIMQAGKVTDPTKLAKADRQQLMDLGRDAASKLGISVTYSNGKLLLVDADGKDLPSVDVKTALIVDGKVSGRLRPTGSDYTVYVAVSGLAVAAIAVAGLRKLKGNA